MNFIEAIHHLRPNVLIGATGTPHTFTKQVIELMSEINPRPTIFALSNPTSHSECTAEQAYRWSKGRCIFASGSPFSEFKFGNIRFEPGQGNNVFIFPGVGLGAIISKSRTITSSMFLSAAKALAAQVSGSRLAGGSVYPALSDIRDVTVNIAFKVAETAILEKHSNIPHFDFSKSSIGNSMYDPQY